MFYLAGCVQCMRVIALGSADDDRVCDIYPNCRFPELTEQPFPSWPLRSGTVPTGARRVYEERLRMRSHNMQARVGPMGVSTDELGDGTFLTVIRGPLPLGRTSQRHETRETAELQHQFWLEVVIAHVNGL